ncbi:MAG: cache domain-containing protein [Arenicella sp.]
MNISQKVLLLALIPMLVAMLLVTLVVNFQTRELSHKQAAAFKAALMEIRKSELINYTNLARSAIDKVYNSPEIDTEIAKSIVQEILNNLEYSEDGYFYAYTEEGVNVVHPKQAFRLGKNWLDLEDSEGKPIIRELINQAQNGGGFTEYLWEKPSLGEVGKKLGYAEMLDKWNWMFGTGMYIDDVDKEVSALQGVMDKHIRDTSIVIMWIAALSVITVFVSGLLLQLSERKLADRKLQELTKRVLNTQDEERRRVARELHDGISQALVAVKYSLEAAFDQLKDKNLKGVQLIKASGKNLDDTLHEIRRISRDLHPSVLDDLGLMAAIESLTKDFQKRCNIKVKLNRIAVKNLLPQDAKTALYRVTQEALTNIERHSTAKNVTIDMALNKNWFQLTISDDGQGFDVSTMQRSRRPNVGIGLRNMAERLSYFKGKFEVQSSDTGTTIIAAVPKNIMAYKNNSREVLT